MPSDQLKRSAKFATAPRRRPGRWARATNATVITIVDSAMRSVLETASAELFTCVHASTATDGLMAVRTHGARAVLLSPCVVAGDTDVAMRRLVQGCLCVSVVAVLGDEWATAHQDLLRLGACGVRRVANLAEREGWNRLRALLAEACDDTTAVIASRIEAALTFASEEARQLLVRLVLAAPGTATVRALSQSLGVHWSTITSQFFRAGLPSPKKYLAMTRLLFAAAYFEMDGVSIVAAASRLGFSSPQAFGRHVRLVMGLTAGEFRTHFTFEEAMKHYVDRLIAPYPEALVSFHPTACRPVSAPKFYRPLDVRRRLAAEA
jgi:AraC-like DNA-binding protein